ISAVGASIIGLLSARWLLLITFVNVHVLVPVVVAVSLTGVYAIEGKPGDVILCLIMGLVGYLMIRFDYPRLTLVIALVLGEPCDRAYHQTMQISDQNMLGFILGRPAATVLLIATVVTLFLPMLRKVLARRRARAAFGTSEGRG